MGSRNGALCGGHQALFRVLAMPRDVFYSTSKSSDAFWRSLDPGGVLRRGELERPLTMLQSSVGVNPHVGGIVFGNWVDLKGG